MLGVVRSCVVARPFHTGQAERVAPLAGLEPLPAWRAVVAASAKTGASAAGSEGALVARTQVAAWVVASTPGFVPGGSSELRGSTKLGKLGRPIACYSVAE